MKNKINDYSNIFIFLKKSNNKKIIDNIMKIIIIKFFIKDSAIIRKDI